ncbi:WD40 repeat-like protein, partial [Gymnopus androsaceus JB14]
HQDYVTWAEYGPDDGIIATASWDRTVRIWNAVNGALIHTLTGPTGQIWSAAFSPDGKLIAAGGDHQVRLWSVESGKLLHTLSGYDDTCRTRSLCFSPDGATLAAGARGGTLRLFSILTGECLQ